MKASKITSLFKYIYIILLLVLIYIVIVTKLIKYKSVYNENETNFNCKILEYETDGNKLSLELKCKEKLIGNYYFDTKEEKENFLKNVKYGYTITLNGTLSKPMNNTVPFLFNYKNYLYNNKIYYILNIDNYKITNTKTNIFYKIKNYAYTHANKIKENYIYAFILGNSNNIDPDIIKTYRTNGISHLFALSGLHVSIFSLILIKILKKLRLKDIPLYIIVFTILLLFSFITGFSPSILRASLLFLLIGINKTLKLNIKTEYIFYLVFIILTLINPFLIYNMSFIMSFLTTYYLIIGSKYINSKNYFISLLKVSTFAFIINVGVSIYYFNYINPLSIIYNLIFVPFVSFIVFPVSLIVFIIPLFSPILKLITNILEHLSLICSKINLTIYFPNINLLEVYIYYIILYLIIKFKKTKYIFLIIIVTSIWKIKPFLDTNTYAYFIDVGQGDSTLIITPHRKNTILIDTGGKIEFNNELWKERKDPYSIATDTLIPLFINLGINKIDYLILTHGDYDHMGEATNLVKNFKVKKVIFNCGEFNELEQDLIKVLNKKKIPHYSCIKEINIDNNKLYFLNNGNYNNENDNSSVIYTKLNNYKFLFMGDAGTEVEEYLIKKYNLENIDILKVGHHGSKTSTSSKFINYINNEYSVISVAKNNRYNHPNKEVLNTLKHTKIYRTDINGTITFKINKNNYKIKTIR